MTLRKPRNDLGNFNVELVDGYGGSCLQIFPLAEVNEYSMREREREKGIEMRITQLSGKKKMGGRAMVT